MSVTVKNHHDYTVAVEGGNIRLELARMSPLQFEAFSAMFDAMAKGRGNPAMKPIAEDETPAAARAREAAHMAYLEENARWTTDTFRQYVRVVEGDLVQQENGEVITDGARFAALYVAEAAGVLAELWLQNALTAEQKKTLQSLHGSVTGSTTASRQAAPGTKPATTAKSAGRRASARPAAATASNSGASSGTTARSRSEHARSSRSPHRSTTSSESSGAATSGGSASWHPPVGSGPHGRRARRSRTKTRG